MLRQLLHKKRSRKELLKLSDIVTGLLRKAVIVLLLLAFLTQIAVQNDTIRNWLTSADRWEGTRLN
ncbi:hypothetical protein [Paenibacillus sp. L3-i20]|uniref:hypothetical protein n=1 Tax=Paenibacillus sp. L3-i20 TaxID=2905833 RepID=UPI001EDD5A2B|nr:hypothetical protein [Paenibacillus sp. L3-i20]